MEVSKLAMFFVMTGPAVAPPADPPTGNPSNPQTDTHGGPLKWRVYWTNGDATAYTRVYYGDPGVSFDSATLLQVELPGATQANTTLIASADDEDQYTFWLVHYKNGEESDTPVSVLTSFFE